MALWLRLLLLLLLFFLFVFCDLSPIASNEDQVVRRSPLHTPVEASIQAAMEASRVAPSLMQYNKGPETASAVNGVTRQGRWKQDSDDQRAEHRPSEAPRKETEFRTELFENPLSRLTKPSGSEEIPEVVIEIEDGTEPQKRIATSVEFAAENLGDRIKRETSRVTDKADKDTDGGAAEEPILSRLTRVEEQQAQTDTDAVAAEEKEERHVGHELSDQHLLYNDLFQSYNKHIRPVHHHDEIITVHFEVALFNVLSVDTKAGLMMTNTEVIQIWNDPYLGWDPLYYNQTKYLRVLYSDVWHPDIILYNSADTSYEDSMINTNIIIDYDGTVTLLTHGIFTSVCDMDIQWFPFDQQTCDMIFSSWTMDMHQMMLELGPSDITRYHANQEFFLEDFYSEQFLDYDPCCKEPFSVISYHIQMQRRVKFALFFFIVPGVLINICALLVFSLPAESGEKVGLGINSMLAMMVFLMAMTENLPPSQTLPVAGVYYGVCLILITFNIVFSVYVLNLSYGGDRGYDVPEWMRKLVLFTARAVYMKIPDFIYESWELNKDNLKDSVNTVTELKGFKHVNANLITVESKNFYQDSHMFKDPYQRRSLEALEGILQVLTREENETHTRAKKDMLVEEWKFLSRVIDRFLFIIFTIATALFNIIILTQSPYGEKFEYCPLGRGMCGDDYELESVADLAAKGGLSGSGGGH
ncbi:acetylcholine receptor subunit alpha-1-B-like [Portunus trituberculatus]|uniref:acetylcholine receptor subunit alpha-1-B-like n=1 Tax=Portunus trituberculatus TaxID=210409 RepID=UPI001E1CF819|nr:acetylcholine receptor subunit alpha-1-B-like [Portunus trituberculatus]